MKTFKEYYLEFENQDNLKKSDKPLYVLLIGLPAAGKSTFLKNIGINREEDTVISSDNIIERYAKTIGKTYDDVFQNTANLGKVFGAVGRIITRQTQSAIAKKKNIFIDMTNLVHSHMVDGKDFGRAGHIKIAKENDYQTIAVLFPTPNEEEHSKRLNNREGKTIPQERLDSMKESFKGTTKKTLEKQRYDLVLTPEEFIQKMKKQYV